MAFALTPKIFEFGPRKAVAAPGARVANASPRRTLGDAKRSRPTPTSPPASSTSTPIPPRLCR